MDLNLFVSKFGDNDVSVYDFMKEIELIDNNFEVSFKIVNSFTEDGVESKGLLKIDSHDFTVNLDKTKDDYMISPKLISKAFNLK